MGHQMLHVQAKHGTFQAFLFCVCFLHIFTQNEDTSGVWSMIEHNTQNEDSSGVWSMIEHNTRLVESYSFSVALHPVVIIE